MFSVVYFILVPPKSQTYYQLHYELHILVQIFQQIDHLPLSLAVQYIYLIYVGPVSEDAENKNDKPFR